MTLFSDPRVVEAVILAAANPVHDDGHTDTYYAGLLDAAVAALPREEMIEKAADAIARAWSNGHARPVALPSDSRIAEAVLVAIGLIPEHVTPEEER